MDAKDTDDTLDVVEMEQVLTDIPNFENDNSNETTIAKREPDDSVSHPSSNVNVSVSNHSSLHISENTNKLQQTSQITYPIVEPVISDTDLPQHKPMNPDGVAQNHQQLMNSNKSLVSHAENIITILGGIDNVLQTCLAKPNGNKLTSKQLFQINDIITLQAEQSLSTIKPDISNQGKISANDTLTASRANTFLRKIFGRNFAAKVINILYNRIVLTISILIMVVYDISIVLFGLTLYIHVPLMIYQLVWIIFIILSINVKITMQTMKTFDFWFKVIYWIRFSVLDVMVYEVVWGTTFGGISYLVSVTNTMGVLTFCLIDGLKMSIKLKVPFMIIISLAMTLMTSIHTIASFSFGNTTIKHVNIFGWTIQVSLLEITASSIRTVCIFFWKQTIATIMRPTKSSMIKRPARIVWVENIE